MNDIFHTNNYIVSTFATKSETRVLTKKTKANETNETIVFKFLDAAARYDDVRAGGDGNCV
jgi:hypothetical protein